MKAFYGIPELKEHYLGRLKWHMDMDHLHRGVGWESNGTTRGCAVGCSMEKYDHRAYEREWQVPEWLARVEDKIFEGMTEEKAMAWPYEFADAINVGANLETIKRPFLIIICESVLEYVQAERYSKKREAINGVIAVLKNPASTNEDLKKARTAAIAADAAAYAADAADAAFAATYADYAVDAAADAAFAATYADYAVDAAAYAAANAAYAAAYTATATATATYVARRQKYDYLADELLKLIRGCK